MSDDSHLPTPLAHGRWAGDRVGRSAREAGASLKTLSKRATLTEQQRHRLGSGSFEWRQPEKQRSQRGGLFWTVFPRGAVQNGAQLDRIAARESEDLLFNAHTSPAMCVELTGGPPVRWFVIAPHCATAAADGDDEADKRGRIRTIASSAVVEGQLWSLGP